MPNLLLYSDKKDTKMDRNKRKNNYAKEIKLRKAQKKTTCRIVFD